MHALPGFREVFPRWLHDTKAAEVPARGARSTTALGCGAELPSISAVLEVAVLAP